MSIAISGLPLAGSIGSSDTLIIVQSGTTKRATVDDLPALAALTSDASNTGAVTHAQTRVVLGSDGGSSASGLTSAVIASNVSAASGPRSGVFVGGTCEATAAYSVVVASRRVINSEANSLAMGDNASGSASTANRKIHLFGATGNIQIAGTVTSSHTFSDFGEYFSHSEGAEIPAGTILTHDGAGVRIADDGDEIAGVVSHTAGVMLGDTPFHWRGRYLTDDFGRHIYETVPNWDWQPGDDETEADRPTIQARKQNPDWNPGLDQTPRSQRLSEWCPVGLLGQVLVRVDDTVASGHSVTPLDGGTGTQSVARTGLRCMSIESAYDAERGYAVARCMINVMV